MSTTKQEQAPAGADYKVTINAGTPEEPNDLDFYMKSPNRQLMGVVLSMIMPSSGQPDYIGAGEVLIKNLALEGADLEKIRADEQIYVSACFQAYQVIDIKTGSIKKL